MDPLRVAIIAIMAYVILGLGLLLQSGQFVLPIGLFKPTFLVILIVGLIIQKKKIQLSEIAAFVWASGMLLTSKFLFFDILMNRELSDDQITFYGDLHNWANLVSYIFLLFWMLLMAWKEKSKLSILQVIGALGFFSCLMLNEFVWIILPTLIWYSGVFLQKNRKTANDALAVFLTFVVVSIWLSAYFFGEEAVLQQV